MIDINNINPIDYDSFYFLGDVGDVKIECLTNEGYVAIDGYDLINHNGNTILAYKKHHVGDHNHSYVFNGKRYYIQLVYHDQLIDFLNKNKYEFFNFFLFVNSIQMPSMDKYIEENKPVSVDINGNTPFRCDYNKYGGSLFSYPTNPYIITKAFNVLSVSGVGHLAYFESKNDTNQNPTHESLNIASRTYAGILKVIYEWSVVAQAPFNNDTLIAKKALQLWNEIELPEDLKNWIINDYCDMRVARYLKGDNEVSLDVEGEEMMPDVLKNYIQSNCRYKTLSSMSNNHPFNVQIPQNILDLENQELQNMIFDFYLRNNLDFDSVNIKDLALSVIYNIKPYQFSDWYDTKQIMEKILCI